MLIYTDSIHYARQILPQLDLSWSSPDPITDSELLSVAESLFEDKPYRESSLKTDFPWERLFVAETSRRSQYDILVELARKTNKLPDGIVCLAGSGEGFHGFKSRPWSAIPGNLHLSVYLAPAKPVEHSSISFMVLAAVSVVDALDSLPGLENRAGIKWVNDIVIDEAKVCGVLAHTQMVKGAVTAAVVGIGLNVETTPDVEPTPFVPEVASLKDCASDPDGCGQREVFETLIRALARNYSSFVDVGYPALLERYRRRSAVVGRRVILCSDVCGKGLDIIAKGRVTGLGENLELFLEGFDQPFWKGRLILESENEPGLS